MFLTVLVVHTNTYTPTELGLKLRERLYDRKYSSHYFVFFGLLSIFVFFIASLLSAISSHIFKGNLESPKFYTRFLGIIK